MFESQLTSLPLINRGKVRDIYDAGAEHLLIVTTDRISAFDVIMPTPIPGKGKLLTAISQFWFERTRNIISNHWIDLPLETYLSATEINSLDGRGMLVKKLRPLPIEAVARGYIIGSGWKDYQRRGQICGITLPAGLQLAEQLPNALFTPATKADIGAHDENISFEKTVELIGLPLAERVRNITLQLYQEAARYARQCGIIIADTKFEFGLDNNDQLILIDEALTPDSSRFWPADEYRIGISPPSFDKQFLRDYLETLDWNKVAPGPALPQVIVEKTAAKYAEAFRRLTQPPLHG